MRPTHTAVLLPVSGQVILLDDIRRVRLIWRTAPDPALRYIGLSEFGLLDPDDRGAEVVLFTQTGADEALNVGDEDTRKLLQAYGVGAGGPEATRV